MSAKEATYKACGFSLGDGFAPSLPLAPHALLSNLAYGYKAELYPQGGATSIKNENGLTLLY